MRSKRRDSFVSFISLFSLAAMAIGVMALIVVLSVMNGFDREIKMRLLRVVPHVTVTSPQGLDRAQINQLEAELKAGADDAPVQVLSVVPMLQSFVMGSSKGNQAGLVLQGIDPESAVGEKLAENMISGYVGQLQAGEFGVVIGSQVARKLPFCRRSIAADVAFGDCDACWGVSADQAGDGDWDFSGGCAGGCFGGVYSLPRWPEAVALGGSFSGCAVGAV